MATDYPLDDIKQDLYRILDAVTRDEALHLLREIKAGRIIGDVYLYFDENEEDKPCGCLVGTIALQRDEENDVFDMRAMGFHVSPDNPIEDYVGGVRYGDTPEDSPELANVAAWIEEWLGVREAVLP